MITNACIDALAFEAELIQPRNDITDVLLRQLEFENWPAKNSTAESRDNTVQRVRIVHH